MSKKMRVVISFIVVELLLACLWFFLSRARAEQGDDSVSTAAEAARTIGSTMGMAMGALAGVFLILFFIAAKNDRQT